MPDESMTVSWRFFHRQRVFGPLFPNRRFDSDSGSGLDAAIVAGTFAFAFAFVTLALRSMTMLQYNTIQHNTIQQLQRSSRPSNKLRGSKRVHELEEVNWIGLDWIGHAYFVFDELLSWALSIHTC
mmetsp:Transcript_7045/g.17684  ORF Transcript_7045/g.17684 Transcript_7045/m.17684 type:complete len:126 (-) Transcript_7045:42-419(-)